jgi:hypothetical protein
VVSASNQIQSEIIVLYVQYVLVDVAAMMLPKGLYGPLMLPLSYSYVTFDVDLLQHLRYIYAFMILILDMLVKVAREAEVDATTRYDERRPCSCRLGSIKFSDFGYLQVEKVVRRIFLPWYRYVFS